MEELRDKLIERAGRPAMQPTDVATLVGAACKLDTQISESQRRARFDELNAKQVAFDDERLVSIEHNLEELGMALDRKQDKKQPKAKKK